MTEKENQISNTSYINKDFQTIYPELLEKAKELSYKWNPTESNESDPGVVLIKENAIIADKLNYNIDKNILETFPLSVSQESNARNLYSELGYSMRWYEGAITSVAMKWNVLESSIKFGEEDVLTLPIFTMVSDENQTVVYTLLDKVTFIGNALNETHTVSAIQGVVRDYQSLSGETKVTALLLDNQNRLYFDDYNVAENGIFINNIGQDNWSQWSRVNNLATQEYGAYVYQFGIDVDTQKCYIEFPDDYVDLFGEGIEIKYVTTSGEAGNISALTLTRLYDEISVDNIVTTLSGISVITADDVVISNTSAATNGKNPEGLIEAYENYKKTVGTFDTLVTLRDYINYLRRGELVSNGFVCDRTDDIQSSYKIVNTQKGFEDYTNIVSTTDGEKDLDAFDLRMYLLQPVNLTSTDVIGTQVEYEQSYQLMPSGASNSTSILNDIYAVKSAQHDFADIKPYELCMLQNKYTVNCKIIPYSRLTDEQTDSLKSVILNALTRKLQSRKMEFGVEVSYDELYQYINECDSRIKSVVLDELNYTTYGIYWDGSSFQEVALNNEAGKAEGLAPSLFIPSLSEPTTWKNSFINYYTRIGTEDNYIYTQLSEYIAPTFETNKYASILLLSNQPDDWAAKYNKYYVYNYDTNSYSLNSSNVFVANVYFRIVTLTSAPDDWDSNYSKYYIKPNSADGSGVYDNVSGIKTTAPTWSANTYYIPARVKFRQEIYAKSVLAGRTQFLKPESDFLYTLYQKPVADVKDVASVSSYVNVELSNTDYTVKENEQIIFVSPKLIDTNNFSGYVKFVINLNSVDDGGVSQINYNTSYRLKANEYIAFLYKQTSESSNEDDIPYTCQCYGEGAIIKPSFTIYNQNNVVIDLPSDAIPTNKLGEPLVTSIPYDEANYNKIKESLGTSNTLSAGKSIIIQSLKPDVLSYDSGYNVYWITNQVEDGQYVLSFDDSGSHILTENEYFMYATSDYSEFIVLGSGYMLTLNSHQSGVQWKCQSIDYATIAQKGQSAITEQRAFISLKDKLGQNDSLTVQDMDIVTIPQKYLVKATPTSDETSVTLGSTNFTDVQKFTISYKAPNDTSYTSLSNIDIEDISWKGKASLSFNLNSSNGQILDDNQVIVAQTEDNEQYVFSSSYTKAKLEAPTFVTNTYYYMNDNNEYVAITDVPDNWSNEWQYTFVKGVDNTYTDTPPKNWNTNYNQYYVLSDGIFTVNTNSTYSASVLYFSKVEGDDKVHLMSNYALIYNGGQNLNTLVLVENRVAGINLFAYTDVDTSEWNDYLSKVPNSDGSLTIESSDTTSSPSSFPKNLYFYIPVSLKVGKYVINVVKVENSGRPVRIARLGLSDTIEDSHNSWHLFDNIAQTSGISRQDSVYYNVEITEDIVDKPYLGVGVQVVFNGKYTLRLEIKPFWEYSVDEHIYNSYINAIVELDKDGMFDYTHIVPDSELVSDPLDSITKTNFNSSGQCFFDSNHIFNKYTIARVQDLSKNISIINKVK